MQCKSMIKLPYFLTAEEIREILLMPGLQVPAIRAAIAGYKDKAGSPVGLGWRPGADGLPRTDFKSVPGALGVDRLIWSRKLGAWQEIKRAEGAWR